MVAATGARISSLVAYHAPDTDETRYFPPDWASVTNLAVLPEYRRTVLGSKLLHACLNIAKSEKAQVFAALLNSRMVGTERFMTRVAFQNVVIVKLLLVKNMKDTRLSFNLGKNLSKGRPLLGTRTVRIWLF